MFRRLGAVLIAVMFALGLLAGFGSTYAAASSTSVTCANLTVDHATADHPSPAGTCNNGAAHMACLVHVSCVAFVLPAAAAVRTQQGIADWHPVPLAGLEGASLGPDTPPPIASL